MTRKRRIEWIRIAILEEVWFNLDGKPCDGKQGSLRYLTVGDRVAVLMEV